MDTHFTVNEAARHLRLAPKTIRRHLRLGDLIGVRFGRRWRIPEAGLRQLASRGWGTAPAATTSTPHQ
jgi:excisionase family DNA binding protein